MPTWVSTKYKPMPMQGSPQVLKYLPGCGLVELAMVTSYVLHWGGGWNLWLTCSAEPGVVLGCFLVNSTASSHPTGHNFKSSRVESTDALDYSGIDIDTRLLTRGDNNSVRTSWLWLRSHCFRDILGTTQSAKHPANILTACDWLP